MTKAELINNLKDIPNNAELICITPMDTCYYFMDTSIEKYSHSNNKFIIRIV